MLLVNTIQKKICNKLVFVAVNTQKICNEAVDDCLITLKFISVWFVTSKMLKKFYELLITDDDVLFCNEDFSKVSFYANQMDILGLCLDKINLNDDNNFYKDDPDIIINVILLAWHNNFEK